MNYSTKDALQDIYILSAKKKSLQNSLKSDLEILKSKESFLNCSDVIKQSDNQSCDYLLNQLEYLILSFDFDFTTPFVKVGNDTIKIKEFSEKQQSDRTFSFGENRCYCYVLDKGSEQIVLNQKDLVETYSSEISYLILYIISTEVVKINEEYGELLELYRRIMSF